MIYFTSDWHIGHNKDFLFKPRGFETIEQHNTAIMLKCNQIVKPEDELWILGDLALGQNEKEWNRIYKSLFCKNIHFIIGNHDTKNKINKYEKDYGFTNEGYVNIFKYSKHRKFYISHYPTLTGNFDDDKRTPLWNLSGHTHSKEKFHSQNCIYNVSLDAHNNYPVSIETILKDILKKEGKI